MSGITSKKTSKRQMLGLTLVGVSALAAGWFMRNQTKPTDGHEGSALEAISSVLLQTLEGATFSVEPYKDQPLLVNFWATWCPPCIEEIPLINTFFRDRASLGLENLGFLGIAIDQAASVAQFLLKTPLLYPTAISGLDAITLSQSLGNASGGLPYTVFLNKKGEVIFVKSGKLTADDFQKAKNLLLTA